MTIRVALEHRTVYRFDRPTTVHPHVVRLRPAAHSRTPISAYSLTVEPAEHFLNWQQDPFGNYLARLVFPQPTRELSFTVDLVADLSVINPFDFFVEDYAETFPFHYPPQLRAELTPYLASVDEYGPGSGPGPLLLDWLHGVELPDDGLRIVDFLVQLNSRVANDVAYTVRMEHGVQSPDQTLRRGIGSCRDSAWLLVSALRKLGLAARFVSGYLVQLTPDPPPGHDRPVDGPFEDFTDLHAWTEVYVPGAGWIGLDSTSGLFAGEGHIPLAATPHPVSAAPISGATGKAEVEFEFSNTVRRVHEDPRVTRPYDLDQWARVNALGAKVDALLEEGDVRLTTGGEPTYVAVDDMESPEWTLAADGPDKRRRAAELTRRSLKRWAPRGVVQHGQGKWYPGEPLPRWQMAVTWRKDGGAMWSDHGLLDSPGDEATLTPSSAESRAAARSLAVELTQLLGLPNTALLPAYEDALYAIWQENLLPRGPEPEVDVDPADPALADPDERAEKVRKLLNELDADPGHPRGWVLPLHHTGNGWGTAKWEFRRGKLILTPGTSPLGLRLPLQGLSWSPPPPPAERSPLEPRGPLAESYLTRYGPRLQGRLSGASDDADPTRAPKAGKRGAAGRTGLSGSATPADTDETDSVASTPEAWLGGDGSERTALCVEERDGHLHVFLPPLTHLEHALDLLAAVESAARASGQRVVLEGYPIPSDPRTSSLTVTPDPGVIEVNVQPASSWAEVVEITEGLDADARASGLATEKFDVDGLHTGTGGGSHLTLGGATPADSPLLRRPDLLRSMLTYWQHHPSLSYLFSGRFVGPTSQAPRVDEARHEAVYELEVAFAELDAAARGDAPAPPWVVDRALRHLLTDLTGNTHRAEFCIDKLYSPDSQRGRLGLLELRAFEMPPHPQMSLVQQLLVRSLVARFWNEPYRGPLVRWGTQLHDRFLLPGGAARDIADVVDDLNAHGIDFESDWLDPFIDFRFPRLGSVEVGGVELELRQAIEPWHVLGEEATGSGTSRFVDSSVERVELRARGVVPERHVITVNGVPVPLGSTGTVGEAAAGVRFTAWQPPSKLHPTIPVQAPLTFDVVDRWNGRSLGGFRYHVSHPGGLAYDTYPVNAAEAETRRVSRFETTAHTPGRIDLSHRPAGTLAPVGLAAVDPRGGYAGFGEYPTTLDLRRHV
ncbi:DUF2126 domain-containing protein [Spongisporangium articulatum]|uniref:DUF2126 domain-containing protein n=1 Tax=Spongisporangium articulatum TaxID=3362603 RepID=A0ABW8AKP6_9ACTN